MQTLNAKTLNHLVAAIAPMIASHLGARPHQGEIVGDLDALLTEVEAAAVLALRPATLGNWRARGHGPAYIRLGTKRRAPIRYKRGVVIEYRDRGTVNPER